MIAIRSLTRNRRHGSAVAALLIVVSLLVVWEHAGEPEPHLDEAGTFCLAVISGLSAIGILSGPMLFDRKRPPRPVSTPVFLRPVFPRPAPLPASRAGPAMLQILRR